MNRQKQTLLTTSLTQLKEVLFPHLSRRLFSLALNPKLTPLLKL